MRSLLGPRLGVRSLATPAIHVLVLCAFAVAQPVYYLFSRNAEFFAVRGSTPADIVVFALGILLVPPAVLLFVEWLACLAGERVQRVVHVLFVAGLSAVILLQGEKHLDEGGGGALVVIAIVAGAAAAFVYVRFSVARTFLTVLLPAPFIFAALFLFDSPVTALLHVDDEPVQAAAVTASAPVVFVMFDELGTVPLLTADGDVNAERFPNFADLAERATFYRDATTVHGFTEHAVPSALTGELPDQGELPIYAHHPQNLFTLLGNGYRLDVRESLTHLCPVSLCRPTEVEPVTERLSSLVSDTGLVYLHIVLPDSMALGLPPVDQTWRDFRGMNVANETGGTRAGASAPSVPNCAPVCGFVRSLTSKGGPSLDYLHVQIPHIPWRYLPSGKRYAGDTRSIPGLDDRVWRDTPLLTDQAYERFLLQAGYADRVLGIVLDRLRDQGMYDDSLVVVMADHGVSFQPAQPRRDPTDETLADLAFMPLFVKLPHQREGGAQDGFVRTIDVLPTIAEALGVKLPEPVDGRSLLHGVPDPDGKVRLLDKDGEPFEAQLTELLAEREATQARWIDLYGDGGWDEIYESGPLADRVGKPLPGQVPETAGLKLDLDGAALYDAYDPDGPLVPAWVTGRIEGADAGLELAVLLNHVVATSTETYAGGRFQAFVPESLLRPGENAIDLAIVGPDGNLQVIPRAADAFTLDGDKLRPAGGGELTVDPEIVHGPVAAKRRGASYVFSGWAVDAQRGRPVDAIAVFADGKLVYTARGETFRTLEPEQHEGVDDSAFSFTLPAAVLPGKGHEVRVFAVSGDTAGELEYAPGFPWR